MKKKKLSKSLKIFIFFTTFFILSIYLSNRIITKNAEEKIFSKTTAIPKNKVGLVLGTSKYLTNGNINLYYKYRIEATIKLFNSNKIEFIVISGDNGSKNYDEPTEFKNDLIKAGKYF